MADFLDTLAQSAQEAINSGYYEAIKETAKSHISLKEAISAGAIRENVEASSIAESMEKGGAVGISVLTEPKHFKGSLSSLVEARKAVKLPILMKDIILSPVQIDAASKAGANAALLIEALFDRGYCECTINDMIGRAHSAGLEVLLETHTADEFRSAVRTHADVIGINNRDLATLKG